MTQSITQLIERLEKAEAGSRELSRGVWLAAGQQMLKSPTIRPGKEVPDESCPPVTTSLDAATALVERALPDHQWRVVVFSDCSAECECWEPRAAAQGGERWQRLRTGFGNTEPIARVSALLKAIQAKEAGQ